ncbi:hypothetical protein [Clavibacter michiganensis]|uniref:hypothetical protein n=1 Tax=Clavibacter michiganensis TaxID=28447 RepID=UPI0005B9DA46|nr:hypothetical protein [Clavibacter michiganensis]
MTDPAPLPVADELRRAWHNLPGSDTPAGRMARKSLIAFASQKPELENILFQLEHSYQAEMDLHLEGASTERHQTDAVKFADLIRGIADSVKEISKAAMGRDRLATTLQVVAPMPGSVRVLLRPAPPSTHDTLEESESETRDSYSLAIVATVLARAGEERPDSSLGLLATGVPQGAYAGLRRAARAVVQADWTVEGILRRPAGDWTPIRITPAAAAGLLAALDLEVREEDTVEVEGHLDGQRRSIGAMWFVPQIGRMFEASVTDPTVLDQVADLTARHVRVRARFAVVSYSPAGSTEGVRKTYSLESISAIEDLTLL